MKLFEYEGKKLFEKYNIPLLRSQLISGISEKVSIPLPLIVKAQVRSTDRKRAGGIVICQSKTELELATKELFEKIIGGEKVQKLLVEELADVASEYYVSFSYDTQRRGPVLAINPRGGSGVHDAHIFLVDVLLELSANDIKKELKIAGFPANDVGALTEIVLNLWKLFNEEKVIVAEINPILKTKDGRFFAGDSKVDLGKRKSVEKMGGDIAVIASGGGASLLNMDALLLAGGKPANYAEYSGNPPKEVVEALTKEVLEQEGIKGCWVIGGTANFTDIFETMSGFVNALSKIKPKPNYPFVIRRGGPRQAEAAKMLSEFAKKEGFEFYIYGNETPMVNTAKYMVDLAYHGKKPPLN